MDTFMIPCDRVDQCCAPANRTSHILTPWQANWLAANGCTEEHQSHDCYRPQQSVQRVHEGQGLQSATVLQKMITLESLGRTLGAF